MSTLTTLLSLLKPDGGDFIDNVADLNNNYDKVDAEATTVRSRLTTLEANYMYQAGVGTGHTATSTYSASVVFAHAYPAAPVVIPASSATNPDVYTLTAVSATGFTVQGVFGGTFFPGTGYTYSFNWHAIGATQ